MQFIHTFIEIDFTNLNDVSGLKAVAQGDVDPADFPDLNFVSMASSELLTALTTGAIDLVLSDLPVSGLDSVPTFALAPNGNVSATDLSESLPTDGADTFNFSDSTSGIFYDSLAGDDEIRATKFNDRLEGGNGDDVLFGLGGKDFIQGGSGNDTLIGGGKRDALFGGAGDDTVIVGKGRDKASGGGGNDTVSFASVKKGAGLSGNEGIRFDGTTGEADHGLFGGKLIAKLSKFENYKATKFDDILNLDSSSSGGTVYGGKGEDQIFATNGNDSLFGGRKGDDLEGRGGDDTLYGGGGNDDLVVGDGNDVAYGGGGNDTLKGSGIGSDQLFGGGGNDLFFAIDGADTLVGGGGADTFQFANTSFWNGASIRDFEIAKDIIDLRFTTFGKTYTLDEIKDLSSVVDGNTEMKFDRGTIILHDIDIDELGEANFLFELG